MKSKEEIDKIYLEVCKDYGSKEIASEYCGFTKGYLQCQEDMKQYIFEVAFQFHRLGKYYGNTSDTHFTDIYEETIKSLNKQD